MNCIQLCDIIYSSVVVLKFISYIVYFEKLKWYNIIIPLTFNNTIIDIISNNKII